MRAASCDLCRYLLGLGTRAAELVEVFGIALGDADALGVTPEVTAGAVFGDAEGTEDAAMLGEGFGAAEGVADGEALGLVGVDEGDVAGEETGAEADVFAEDGLEVDDF